MSVILRGHHASGHKRRRRRLENSSNKSSPWLVVDLDGTLIRSDLLHESFWSAFSMNWRTAFQSFASILKGRACLKKYLAENSNVDVTTLPYNRSVLEYITTWRNEGGSTALVTASDQSYADLVGEHLGLFDEIHGSDGTTNLKGESKARFLSEHFADSGYNYVGDSSADLPVWQNANIAITVDVSAALKNRAENLGVKVNHLVTSNKKVSPYIKAARPYQWVKNILVFLPAFAAHQIGPETLTNGMLAFLAFSLIASSVYITNDLLDLSADRAHPRKKTRPFASGDVPIAHGFWMASLLMLLGLLVASFLGIKFLFVIVLYWCLTTLYSLYLKRQIVLDICVLAGLYTIRIVAGGVASEILLSVWLLVFSTFFFFFLAAIKRQAELVDVANRGLSKASGRSYRVTDLPLLSTISIVAGYLSVLVSMLYVNSPAVLVLYQFPHALWGLCSIMLFWVTHVVFITHHGSMNDDPIVFAFKDRTSQVCALLVLLSFLGSVSI